MKILTIPLLVHDTSICILEDGKITSYQYDRIPLPSRNRNFGND